MSVPVYTKIQWNGIQWYSIQYNEIQTGGKGVYAQQELWRCAYVMTQRGSTSVKMAASLTGMFSL